MVLWEEKKLPEDEFNILLLTKTVPSKGIKLLPSSSSFGLSSASPHAITINSNEMSIFFTIMTLYARLIYYFTSLLNGSFNIGASR